MLECRLTFPVRVLSLRARDSDVQRNWQQNARRYGLGNWTLVNAINGSDDATMRALGAPASLLAWRGCDAVRSGALKRIAIWASQQQVLESARGSRAAVTMLLEEDVALQPSICNAVRAVLDVYPASQPDGGRTSPPLAWDLLFLGHCAENYPSVGRCHLVAANATTARQDIFVTRGAFPMCPHALLVSAAGAAKLHRMLRSWPESYAASILAHHRQQRQPPSCSFSQARLSRSKHHPVTAGHDVAMAKMIDARQLTALLVWPQQAMQPWQAQQVATGRRSGISDTWLPRACAPQRTSTGLR